MKYISTFPLENLRENSDLKCQISAAEVHVENRPHFPQNALFMRIVFTTRKSTTFSNLSWEHEFEPRVPYLAIQSLVLYVRVVENGKL